MKWTHRPGPCESLAVALCAVLADRGVSVSYEQLVFELGLGMALTADPGRPVWQWAELARDAALVETAALHGLRVRDMHPPDAAVGLESSAEYPQHFEDSYRPLIRRALEYGQVVLAWGGWPPPAEHEWGVICEQRGEALLGFVNGGDRRAVRHAGSSPQAYVVEDVVPAAPSAPDVIAHAVASTLRFWDGSLADSHGVQSGEEAYVRWIATTRGAGPEASVEPHYELCRRLGAARTSVSDACELLGAGLDGAAARLARAWSRASLESSAAMTCQSAARGAPAARDLRELIERVERGRTAEVEFLMSLRQFARGAA
ncbi:hypothetical protein RAS1_19880 [Phycisphaerae bacterium RAS1]|nr:hypothetical protein RAS1_19880 [Phycisphaerae bacterium RAS1]